MAALEFPQMTRRLSLTPKALLLASVAAAILSAPMALASPGDPGENAPKQGRAARHEGRALRRMGARRAARFLRLLELSDAQKAQLSDARTAADPVRVDARAKVRAILEEAKKGERTPDTRAKVREQVKAVLAAARSQVEPSAKRMLDALTADQRAKLAERAAKHGKTLDDAKLLQRFERVILAPARRRDAR
jgi:Spy/CpxP family protein refolding chaperone